MNFDDYETLPTNNVSSHMTAGAIAGVLEHSVMFPIDSVKTRLQSMSIHKERDIFSVMHRMVSEEGLFRPMRGVQAVVMGAGPAHALYFASYEFLKETFISRFKINNQVAYGTAGVVSTVLHDGIMTPSDAIKQRLQMYNSPFRSISECIRKVYVAEGVGAFYRSYTTQLLMNVPFQSIHFIIYEMLQLFSNPSREYNPVAHMFSGAAAGGIAAAITTPLDVCKTLLNTQSEGNIKIRGMFNAIRTVYKLQGTSGFFKGLSARVIYQMPSTAICWSTYECAKYILLKRKEDHYEAKARELPSLSPAGLYGVPSVVAFSTSDPKLLEVTRS